MSSKRRNAGQDRESPQAKDAAKIHLKAADHYIRNSRFDKAREELEKAKELDPTNIYIDAFWERIAYFEQQQKSEAVEEVQPEEKNLRPYTEEEEENRRADLEMLAEEQGRRRARTKKMEEFIGRANEFLGAKEFEAALTEISKALALDPMSEDGQKLLEEIEQAERRESRRVEAQKEIEQAERGESRRVEAQKAAESFERLADQYKGTILLISSDPAVTTDLSKKLKSSGYAVVSAPNPETALNKIEKISPNLILSDVEFSKENLSGIKFLHVLRLNSKFSFIPFIFLCDPEEIDQLQSSELRPIEGYIQKPVEVDELIVLMNEKLKHFKDIISALMT